MEQSVYKTIYDAIEGEALPEGFELPAEESAGSSIRWAPGAMDGVWLFHMAHEELSGDALAAMEDAVDECETGDFQKAEELFYEWTKEQRALSAADALQRYIVENKDAFDLQNLYYGAVHLISVHPECVKIGLMILELFGEPSEDLKDIICALALCDELTLPAVWNIANWPEGPREVFDIAKHTHGWGRIHALNVLKPDTDEMRQWVLEKGINNTVSSAYSALTCWEKGEAEKVLDKEDLSEREYTAILRIIDGLLDEGPVRGISALNNREDILLKVLLRAPSFELPADSCETIDNIRTWAENGEPPVKAVIDAAESYLHSPACRRAVENAVRIGRCTSLAEELGIPFFDRLYECMKDNFDTMWTNCTRLLAEPAYTDPVLNLFREHLPLETMRGPVDPDLMFTGDFYPYMQLDVLIGSLKEAPLSSTDLIRTALNSKAEKNRITALKLLQKQVQDTGLSLSDLSPELYRAVQDSIVPDTPETVKELAEPLLEGFTVFHEDSPSADRNR